MKYTAVAPSNIAFIKYWGKQDEVLRIPTNPSISMNLSEAWTHTTVEFSDAYKKDSIHLVDGEFTESEKAKVSAHLDRIRKQANMQLKAKVVTKNSFPKGTGIASSASGFAALTVAASNAAGLSLSEKELSILARLGSGSACRSIPDGFVIWEQGSTSDTSFARSLYPYDYWDLRDILVVVTSEEKKTGSAGGMNSVTTSPLWPNRLREIPDRIKRVQEALEKKEIALLGETIEADSFNMHAVMQTQVPPLYYWTDATKTVVDAVHAIRQQGIGVYITIDAGPNVHLICEATEEERVVKAIQAVPEVKSIMVNKPAQGAHVISDHLF